MMLNNVNLMGRLTRDPELRHTTNGTPVASYALAVNRDFKTNGNNETDFIDIIAWQKGAEFASTYFRKGQLVAVNGRIQSRKWTDKDGKNRVSIEVVAERQYFAESKKDDASVAQNVSDFAEVADDGELPF
jgi:single-strand DNA-binding protein